MWCVGQVVKILTTNRNNSGHSCKDEREGKQSTCIICLIVEGYQETTIKERAWWINSTKKRERKEGSNQGG